MNQLSQLNIGISILEITYIIASILFILGLKMLSHPLTARRGNTLAAIGMGLAIITTILFHQKDGKPIGNIGLILVAIGIGTVIGWVIAKRVKMTAMPQLVSFFNGMGGAAAALISIMEFPHISPELIAKSGMANGHVLAILLGLMIGTVSWAGSMIAFGKLDGWIGDMRIKAMKYVNLTILAVLIGFIVFIMTRHVQVSSELTPLIYIMFVIAVIYGVLFVNAYRWNTRWFSRHNSDYSDVQGHEQIFTQCNCRSFRRRWRD
jgi:NAD(P) transhydrogenase subunit beta